MYVLSKRNFTPYHDKIELHTIANSIQKTTTTTFCSNVLFCYNECLLLDEKYDSVSNVVCSIDILFQYLHMERNSVRNATVKRTFS